MMRWSIRHEKSKTPIVWGMAKTEATCKRQMERALKKELYGLNPARLVFEITAETEEKKKEKK